jgi:hypothetical protein
MLIVGDNMSEEQKELLLNIDDYQLFEDTLYSINSAYKDSYELWDEELLEHYNHLLSMEIREQPKLIEGIDVMLGE